MTPLFWIGLARSCRDFFLANWRWLVPLLAAAALWLYINHLQAERDAAINSLASYEQSMKSAAESRRLQNQRKDAEAKAVLNAIHLNHQAELETLWRKYESGKKSDLADREHTIALWRDRVRLEVARGADGGSEIFQAPGQSAEGGGNCDATAARKAYENLELACAITTSDYNALWSSWDKACQVYGCKD